jgi:multiple sugar transport system substrate-binding protein
MVMVKKAALAGVAGLALFSLSAQAATLVVNADTSDPAPKKAIEYVVEVFKKENPGVEVKLNLFDHEGYKTAIRNFLGAEAPDVTMWYSGRRSKPFVDKGLFEDISDVWQANGLDTKLGASKAALTFDGKQYGVPYSYYQWGVYYRKDLFAKVGATEPKTWAEFLEACKKLKDAGITPITIGSKEPWTTAGWFDYLNLRTNGYDFHMELTSGKVPYTDARVKETFKHWEELVKPGYFIANHPSYDWQAAVPFMAQGKAAMYLMGNFAVDIMKSAGIKADDLGFFQFPAIKDGVALAEEAPTDSAHIPSKAKNKEDAKKFLAVMTRGDVQGEVSKILGQLPVNSEAAVPEDKFLKAGFEMLSKASATAQFYDRDTDEEMAKIGMEGFQEFMVKPERLDAVLERLEKARARIFK